MSYIDQRYVQLENNGYLKGLKANATEKNILKINASDDIEFSENPKVGGSALQTETQVDAKVAAEAALRAAADAALDARIDSLESLDPVEYKGVYNASTNSPSLADGTGNNGDVYHVSVAGSVNFGSGSISFEIGDKVVYNGATAKWEKWDMTDAVSSVNGQTGAVVLTTTHISEGSSLYFTEARAKSAAVADSITNGVTDVAPSQNAVFDALALKASQADLTQEIADRIADVDAEESRALAAEAALDARIDSLEGMSSAKEVITVNSTHYSQGYVDLAFLAKSSSISAHVGRIPLHEGASEDYTVSTVGGVSRITFVGLAAAGQAQEIKVGKKLYFQYQK